ncbi:MAG: hypothetical protein WCG87_02975 [Bacteroidota bacterium]
MIKKLFIESYLFQKHLHGSNIAAVIGSFLFITFIQALNVNSIVLGMQMIIPGHIRKFFFHNKEGITILCGIYAIMFIVNFILVQPLSAITRNEELRPKSHMLLAYTLFSLVIVLALTMLT